MSPRKDKEADKTINTGGAIIVAMSVASWVLLFFFVKSLGVQAVMAIMGGGGGGL